MLSLAKQVCHCHFQPKLGADVVAIQKKIKADFDPNGILNPGRKI